MWQEQQYIFTVLPQNYINSLVFCSNTVCRDPDLPDIPLNFMRVHYINAWVLVGPGEQDALESPVGKSIRVKESSCISKLFKSYRICTYYLQAPQDNSSKVKSQLLCAGHYILHLIPARKGYSVFWVSLGFRGDINYPWNTAFIYLSNVLGWIP